MKETEAELNRILNRLRNRHSFAHWAAAIVRNVRHRNWKTSDVKLALKIVAGSDWAAKSLRQEMITATTPDEKVRDKPGKKKIAKVMGEFKEGELKSSSGEKVTSKAQATAIALSEARRAKKK